jgi:hypothetical protein
MKNLIMLLLATGICCHSSAQNNPIFKGGNADGWGTGAFQQASGNIFTGGDGDGWSKVSFSQAANNIFSGGTGDGWYNTSFSQPAGNIFAGGAGDGWDKVAYAQSANAIFSGGDGDGWDKANFSQPGNNIFFGGTGDGWASTYRPMGPLPVTLLYFTARKNSAISSLLEWKTSQEINTSHFDVERSNDAVVFSKIGRLNAAGNSSVAIGYSFIDNNPMAGNNYYRLKQYDLDGRFTYTPARLVRFDDINLAMVKYYPNPTKGMLNIEIADLSRNEAKVINITNAAGVVIDQLRLPASSNRLTEINMSRYPAGTYFVQLRTATINNTQRVILQ